ncbi:DUF6185 family protein [Streptomyces sp. TLI_185]|uniref:DUF6185 family protein n=1 Tax=Streptomyces sp. TLI_185 TaxID=2485151 RepID=UPI000F50283F|nr:DUF6185 family protein [Streptomyces sp. TLI_185]
MARADAAHAVDDATECQESMFAKSAVSTSLRLNEHRYDDGTVTVTTVIEVPADWPLREGLLLSPKSALYRRAMRCLLADGASTEVRDKEERDNLPVVVTARKETTVTDTVWVALSDRSSHDVGPWRQQLDTEGYRLTLNAPPALRRASWDVSLERDGNNLLDPVPKPTQLTDDAVYKWEDLHGAEGPELNITIDAPWRIRTVARTGQYPTNVLICAAQAFAVLAVFVPFLISRVRERGRHPADPRLRVLTVVVGIQLSIALLNAADFGLYNYLTAKTYMDQLLYADTAISSAYQQVIAAAWMLVAAMIFHLGVTRHLARARFTLVPGALVAGAAGWMFYHSDPRHEVLLCLNGVLTLMLYAGTAGICLDGWRAARGQATRWRHLAVALGVGAVITAMTLGSFLKNIIDTQHSQRWLLEDRSIDLSVDLLNYPSYLGGALVFTWWIAVLAASVPVLTNLPRGHMRSSVRLLVVILGGIALEDWPDWYAGIPVSLVPATTTVVLLTGIRINKSHALLNKHLDPVPPGATSPGDTIGELLSQSSQMTLNRLRATAHAYHSLEQEGRKLDAAWKSTSDMDAESYRQKGERIEGNLDRLSDWPPPSDAPAVAGPRGRRRRRREATVVGRLPDGVTPVDVAMSLGPSASPWQNGLRASLYMTVMSLPVMCYLYTADYAPSWWTDQFSEWFGPLWLVYWVLMPLLGWAACGFLLGFFWQELPGRRGPVKILPIVLAYVSAMLLDSFVRYALDQSAANYQWGITGLLTIALTLTSIAMDASTLRAQRASWATSWSPLASVYRLGAAHTGLALIVAQAAAIVSLWLQLRSGMDASGGQGGPSSEGK